MYDSANWNAGQNSFIEQCTRALLVQWGLLVVGPEGPLDFPPGFFWDDQEDRPVTVFAAYAIHKGWVNKKMTGLTAKGYSTAASYLKRGSAVTLP